MGQAFDNVLRTLQTWGKRLIMCFARTHMIKHKDSLSYKKVLKHILKHLNKCLEHFCKHLDLCLLLISEILFYFF